MNNDKDIVRSILSGNEKDFSLIVDRYYQKLIYFFFKMNLAREDAEDIVQEVFIKVYKNLYKYNEGWCFTTWLYKIAVNTFNDLLKKKRLKTTNIDVDTLESDLNFKDLSIDNVHNRIIVKTMLDSMDNETKTIMILRYFYSFSFKDIGVIVNSSQDAVKMRVCRERGRLNKMFSENVKGVRSL
ncbi:UNVERIFIED_CONTAM: RNA polymerase sigma-70 factor (ECF subfamily) [Acetivibrio alkalicellulosi]